MMDDPGPRPAGEQDQAELAMDHEQTLATWRMLVDLRFRLLAFVPAISGVLVALGGRSPSALSDKYTAGGLMNERPRDRYRLAGVLSKYSRHVKQPRPNLCLPAVAISNCVPAGERGRTGERTRTSLRAGLPVDTTGIGTNGYLRRSLMSKVFAPDPTMHKFIFRLTKGLP
jgi:hypothetical protein